MSEKPDEIPKAKESDLLLATKAPNVERNKDCATATYVVEGFIVFMYLAICSSCFLFSGIGLVVLICVHMKSAQQQNKPDDSTLFVVSCCSALMCSGIVAIVGCLHCSPSDSPASDCCTCGEWPCVTCFASSLFVSAAAAAAC